MILHACPACRLAGRAGALHAVVGAKLMAPDDVESGERWPMKCVCCGHEDDGNRLQQSPHHIPFPLPTVVAAT